MVPHPTDALTAVTANVKEVGLPLLCLVTYKRDSTANTFRDDRWLGGVPTPEESVPACDAKAV